MHSGINYVRYLREHAGVEAELNQWLAKYQTDGKKNGWIPPAESRSADENKEDLKQRFFMTKEAIKTLEKEQPMAKFSTDTQFTLMTDQEFANYVKNSYIGSGRPETRGAVDDEDPIEYSDKTAGRASNDSVIDEPMAKTAASVSNLKFESLRAYETEPSTNDTRRLQTSKDWSTSACNAPIQSQGACGSCWAFASVGAVETAQCLASGGSVVKYSEQQLASCDTSNSGCNGGAPVYAMRYIQEEGLCRGSDYPYTSGSGRVAQCSSTCQKTQVAIKQVTVVSSGESGLTSVLNKQPVVVAVFAANTVWKQYTGGVISSCPSAQLDHAVIAIGYDVSTIKIKNSWGTRWGENGYVRLKRGTGGRGTCGVLTDMSYPQM